MGTVGLVRPKWDQERFKRRPDRLKTDQDRAKNGQERAKRDQEQPKSGHERPKNGPELIWKASWLVLDPLGGQNR